MNDPLIGQGPNQVPLNSMLGSTAHQDAENVNLRGFFDGINHNSFTVDINFPNIRPALILDFSNAETIDGRVTFERTSSGTFYDCHTTHKEGPNILINNSTLGTQTVQVANSNYRLLFSGAGTVTFTGTPMEILVGPSQTVLV